MLDIVFVTMLIAGVVFQILTIYWESWPLAILTAIWFLKLMIDSYNIQTLYVYQPVYNVTSNSVVEGSYGYAQLSDAGLSAILLVFVFVNIVLAIAFRAQYTFKGGVMS